MDYLKVDSDGLLNSLKHVSIEEVLGLGEHNKKYILQKLENTNIDKGTALKYIEEHGYDINKFNASNIDDVIEEIKGLNSTYTNWEQMKEAHKHTVTKYVKENKPKGSPTPKNWFSKGGTITIEKLSDGIEIWKYSKGNYDVTYLPVKIGDTTNYVPNFSSYLQPNKSVSSINIGSFSGDRAKDIQTYLNMTGLDEIPTGYVLHHTGVNGIVELVEVDVHQLFSHVGGHSLFK